MDLEEYLQRKSYFHMPSELPIEDMEWSYNQYFEHWVKQYPAEQHDDIRESLQYIKAYVAQQPDFDGEEWSIPGTALDYFENRDTVLAYTKLSEEAFDNFEILQTEITNLGLSPKATFEFIAYLWFFLKRWSEKYDEEKVVNYNIGKPLRLGMKLRRVVDRINDNPDDNVEINIKVGSKHFKFANTKFAKSMIAAYLNSDNVADLLEETETLSMREVSYILVRTLLTYLPIKHKKEKKGTFTQSERTFGLCVLWLNKYFAHYDDDDPIDKCIDNNQTFDKMMRDFKDTRIPLIMPPFLYGFGRWR